MKNTLIKFAIWLFQKPIAKKKAKEEAFEASEELKNKWR